MAQPSSNNNNNLQYIINDNNDMDDDIKIDHGDESTVSLENDINNLNNQQDQPIKPIKIETGINVEIKNNNDEDNDNDEDDETEEGEYLWKGKYSSTYLEKKFHELLQNYYDELNVDNYYDCRELHNLFVSFANNFFVDKLTDFVKEAYTNDNK